MNDYVEIERISNQIVALLEGQNLNILARIARHFELGAITKHEVYREDELLCDPIIWVEEDLEEATLDQWNSTRAPKTLLERSVEDGQETRQLLEQWAIEEGGGE